MESRPSNNRRILPRPAPKPYMIVTRWRAFGWLLSFFVFSGCMFVIGVVIGRNTAPVFDTDLMDAKMTRLRNSSLIQIQKIEKGIEAAQKQKEHVLEIAQNINIFEPLKEAGKSIMAYQQYVPGLKTPKYDKNEKPKEEPPATDQKPAEQTTAGQMTAQQAPGEQPPAQPAETQVAMAQPMEQPPQENLNPATSGPSAQAGSEQPPQEKPLAIKEGAKKPKFIGEIVKEKPPAPVLAQLQTKPPEESVSLGNNSAQQQAPVVNQEATGVQQNLQQSAPAESPKTEAESCQPKTSKKFTIQVASLKELDKANILKERFQQKGYPAYCVSSPVRGEVFHRVRIGPYPDRATAENDCRRLEEAGFDAFLFAAEW